MIKGKTILLIGGSGYVGSVIVEYLLRRNYTVKTLDLLLYKNGTCVINYINNPNYEFIFGDMCNRDILLKSLIGVDCVILLAGLVGDPITKKYPNESKLINDHGVKNVIDLCVENNINKFIFISTCSNYGMIENNNCANEEYSLNPLSLYAKSKVSAEKYILSFKGKTNLKPTILRFATAFGLSPRMRFDLTVNEFTRELTLGNELIVYDADTWRPYCHVQDFARLVKIVIEAESEKVSFEVFNAGGEKNNFTKQMVVDTILKKIHSGKVKYVDHGSDPRNYKVNFEKVKKKLGFEPKYSIENGVTEIIDSINNHLFDHVDYDKDFFGNYNISYK